LQLVHIFFKRPEIKQVSNQTSHQNKVATTTPNTIMFLLIINLHSSLSKANLDLTFEFVDKIFTCTMQIKAVKGYFLWYCCSTFDSMGKSQFIYLFIFKS